MMFLDRRFLGVCLVVALPIGLLGMSHGVKRKATVESIDTEAGEPLLKRDRLAVAEQAVEAKAAEVASASVLPAATSGLSVSTDSVWGKEAKSPNVAQAEVIAESTVSVSALRRQIMLQRLHLVIQESYAYEQALEFPSAPSTETVHMIDKKRMFYFLLGSAKAQLLACLNLALQIDVHVEDRTHVNQQILVDLLRDLQEINAIVYEREPHDFLQARQCIFKALCTVNQVVASLTFDFDSTTSEADVACLREVSTWAALSKEARCAYKPQEKLLIELIGVNRDALVNVFMIFHTYPSQLPSEVPEDFEEDAELFKEFMQAFGQELALKLYRLNFARAVDQACDTVIERKQQGGDKQAAAYYHAFARYILHSRWFKARKREEVACAIAKDCSTIDIAYEMRFVKALGSVHIPIYSDDATKARHMALVAYTWFVKYVLDFNVLFIPPLGRKGALLRTCNTFLAEACKCNDATMVQELYNVMQQECLSIDSSLSQAVAAVIGHNVDVDREAEAVDVFSYLT